MKKIYIIIVALLSIFLFGCENQWNKFRYNFDGMNGYFFTDDNYDINNSKLEWLWYKLINNEIVTIYSQTSNTSGFVWSLIITKKITDQTLSNYVNENIDLVWLDWFKIEKTKDWHFTCDNKKIETKIVNSRLKNNLNTIYFSEIFFEKDWYIYTISFANSDKNERNNFANTTDDISCTKSI